MKRKILYAVMLILCLGLSGCASNTKSGEKIKTVKAGEAEFKTIGKKEGRNSLFVYNQTGKRIKGLKIRESGKKKWSRNLLENGAVILNREKVQVFLPVKVLNKKYDFDLSFDNKDQRVLSNVDISDTKSIRIFRTKRIAYIEYVSIKKKDIFSTREAEQKIWEKAELKRKEEERKKAEEEARQRAAEEAAQEARRQSQNNSNNSGGHRKSNNTSKRREENCEDSGQGGHYADDGNGGWKWIPD